jgi:hypothetical protein
MVDFITKPIQPDELWAALRRWIKPKNAADEAHAVPPAPTFRGRITPRKAVEKQANSEPIDPEKLQQVCSRLIALLADDDSEAGDLFADEGDLLNAGFPDHYRAIDDAIKRFEFEAALEKIELAAKSIGLEVSP